MDYDYICSSGIVLIKYASGVLAAARFPIARLRSAGGFNLQRRYETHAEDENVNLAHSSHD